MAKKLTTIEKFVKQMDQLSVMLKDVKIWCPCSRGYTMHELEVYDKLDRSGAPFHAKMICTICCKAKYLAPKDKE